MGASDKPRLKHVVKVVLVTKDSPVSSPISKTGNETALGLQHEEHTQATINEDLLSDSSTENQCVEISKVLQ